MTTKSLGRLERVELRDIWASGASDFTPWLAREENLTALAETLAIDLELEAQERSVGPFRADILCKDIGRDLWVLIENQLERTDHGHLGQLLTYASGLDAVTIVWIAARFTEEHRSTLDWLNKITDDTFQFFGLEVELWRIGDSPAAPKFNVISKPNDWSHSVAKAAHAIDEAELSKVRLMQRDYWRDFDESLAEQGGPVAGGKKAQAQSWMAYPIGRSGFLLSAVMLRWKGEIRAELYISGPDAKGYLALLKRDRETTEQRLGYQLDWESMPNRQDCRVAVYLEQTDPDDSADWPRQHQWLATKLNELHRAFAARVRSLDLADLQPGDADDDPPSAAPTADRDSGNVTTPQSGSHD